MVFLIDAYFKNTSQTLKRLSKAFYSALKINGKWFSSQKCY